MWVLKVLKYISGFSSGNNFSKFLKFFLGSWQMLDDHKYCVFQGKKTSPDRCFFVSNNDFAILFLSPYTFQEGFKKHLFFVCFSSVALFCCEEEGIKLSRKFAPINKNSKAFTSKREIFLSPFNCFFPKNSEAIRFARNLKHSCENCLGSRTIDGSFPLQMVSCMVTSIRWRRMGKQRKSSGRPRSMRNPTGQKISGNPFHTHEKYIKTWFTSDRTIFLRSFDSTLCDNLYCFVKQKGNFFFKWISPLQKHLKSCAEMSDWVRFKFRFNHAENMPLSNNNHLLWKPQMSARPLRPRHLFGCWGDSSKSFSTMQHFIQRLGWAPPPSMDGVLFKGFL